MSYQPGPKELALKAMREDKANRPKRNKPSTSDLRAKIQTVPKTKIRKPK